MHKDMGLMLAAAALVAVAGYFLTGKKPIAATPAQPGGSPDQVINNGALPGQPGWGWQYYTGGVAIAPDGAYYLNGNPVFRPQ